MKVVKIEDFYKELKNYPVECGMVSKSWIHEIFNEIQFEIKKTKDDTYNIRKVEEIKTWKILL